MLIPRVQLANRPGSAGKATPVEGLLVYQTDNDPGFYYYDGTLWQKVGKNSERPSASFASKIYPTTPYEISGNGNISFATLNLTSDVTADVSGTTFTVLKPGLYTITYSIYLGLSSIANIQSWLSSPVSDASVQMMVFASHDSKINATSNAICKGTALVQLSAGTPFQLSFAVNTGGTVTVNTCTLSIAKL